MISPNVNTDVVVVGAGPIGLFTVFAAGMLDMNCHVVDILDKPGGQCYALYPEKNIYDVPAIPVITGTDLVRELTIQASRFNPTYHMNRRVINVKRDDNSGVISVLLSSGEIITCRAVIIAAGNGAINPRSLDAEGAAEFEDKSLFYHIKDVTVFAGTKIAIVGGGNSAVDWAIMLSDIAAKISLVHRRDRFTCFPDSENKLRDLAKVGKIDMITKYQIVKLEGDSGVLKKAYLNSTDGGECREIAVDNLLVFLGLNTDTGNMASWGLETAQFGRISVNPRDMSTCVPGVFAVGDVVEYPGKLRLISTGFGEASSACHAARALAKDTPFHFEYSTNKLEDVAL